MQPFDYYRPVTFEEAFKLLTQPGKTIIPIAGATDVIPQTRDKVLIPDAVIDVKALPDLRSLQIKESAPCCGSASETYLYVGAAVRMNELARSGLVQEQWPILADSAASMGNEQIRNRATIGGNICTSSPAADSAPALYALEAEVLIRGPEGDRCLPIEHFFTGPKQNALRTGEIVTALLIPALPQGTLSYHEKLSRRKAGDLSIVSIAALAMPAETGYTWRLALGAVGPTPVRSRESESILAAGHDDEAIDRAAASAYACCCAIGDIRSGLEYRQAMIINLTRRAIQAISVQLPNR